MGRFHAVGISAASAASGAYICSLTAAAGSGFKVRRISLGVYTTTAVTPTSQQIVIAAFRFTAALTGGTAVTANNLDPNSPAPAAVFKNTAAGTALSAGTVNTTPDFQLAFNSQSAADLPWEQLEEWIVSAGTGNGIVLINQIAAIPTNHIISAAVEWEE